MQQWQPGHWFGLVTQPFFFLTMQHKLKTNKKIKNKKQKNKKVEKIKKNKRCVCMHE
jgi:hypothetical protein